MAYVAVLIGSISDIEIIKPCLQTLTNFGVEYDLRILSAHRTPEETHEFASTAWKRGIKVIICAAGMAAHLAGAVAASTTLPVIGIPVDNSGSQSLDALLSTVQMPPGVPVATMAVNGAGNAGLLAVQMLALSNNSLMVLLEKHKQTMCNKIEKMNESLNSLDLPKA